ncbi:MAG: hypothetical protein ACK5NT_14605 [Pyrinomonadaceae bacterium]
MSIFQEFIDELKEENLIEDSETVVVDAEIQEPNQNGSLESIESSEQVEDEIDSVENEFASVEIANPNMAFDAASAENLQSNGGLDEEKFAVTHGSSDSSDFPSQDLYESSKEVLNPEREEFEPVEAQAPPVTAEFESNSDSGVQTTPEDVAEECEIESVSMPVEGLSNPVAASEDRPTESTDAGVLGSEEAGFEMISNAEEAPAELPLPKETQEVKTFQEEKDGYAQRLIDEVSGLQVVEYILSGIEREKMRTAPHQFDSVPVKQSLHLFLEKIEVAKEIVQTSEEQKLRSEIQRWNEALLERDAKITTSFLRQYCEENNLTSKSVVALARFYRNSTFSEMVRSKFDLVVTRLFSRESGAHQRELVLNREEVVRSLNELYADWSSIPVYSTDEEDSELLISAFKFEDFIGEAKQCKSIDELLTSGFFKRVKAFKKKTAENFYAPLLVTSAIECNIAVGNQYVRLIEKEKTNAEGKSVSEKFGRTHDKNVSDATSKTLQLVELLNERKTTEGAHGKRSRQTRSEPRQVEKAKGRSPLVKAVVTFVIIVGTIIGVYSLYSVYLSPNKELTASEKKVQLERSFLHEYIESATIKDSTFHGTVSSKWNEIPKTKKQEIVGKLFQVGKIKGFSHVELKDSTGKVVGTTLGSTIEIAD